MPPRTTGRIDDVPLRLAGLAGLPQHEVARIVLRVVVGIDSRAVLHAFLIEARQSSVGRERGDLEVDRSVAPVRVTVLVEPCRDHARHRLDVGFGSVARRASSSTGSRPIVRESSRKASMNCVVCGRRSMPCLLRTGNGPVVHVREIHHLPHAEATEMPQRPTKHVHAHERPKVSDVAARVHGKPARVHADGVVLAWRKGFFGASEGVVEAHREPD